jgi:hypothetical protein
MFDLDPIGTTFLIIAVLWLVAIAYGAMTAEHTSATKSHATSITAMTNR